MDLMNIFKQAQGSRAAQNGMPDLLSTDSVTDNPMSPSGAQPSGGDTQGFISNVLNVLMGRPDGDLSQKELAKRNQDRRNASQMANQAMESQGEEYMNPPVAGGSGFGLQDIARLAMGLFK